jgi:transcriptional regulator with XRE-family HTH domain
MSADKTTSFFRNIQRLCALKGISVTALGQELGLSNSTTSGWRSGSLPRGKTIKMLADYFGISVDVLLSDGDLIVQDNHGVIGDSNSNITINNGASSLGEYEKELLSVVECLNWKSKSELLLKAHQLKEEQE